MKKYSILVVLAVAIGAVAWTQNSTEIWLKGPVYLGTSKTALSSASGAVSFSISTSLTTSITAYASGGQASAVLLASDYSIITVCATAGDSVRLPIAASGREMTVFNNGATAADVFPGSGDTINELAADSAVSIPSGGVAVFRGLSASAWKVTARYNNNGSVVVPTAAAVSAAGTDKTDATALTKEYNTITGTALQGVSLLTAKIGQHQAVYNDSAVTLVVYPLDAGNDTLAVGDLAALSADVGYAVGPRGKLDCTAYTTTAWHCEYTMGAKSTVVAAGDTIADGTAFGSATMGCEVNVTGADGTKAVTLPTGGSATTYIPGCISVFSSAVTSALDVFPNNSDNDTIAAGAADAVFVQTARSRVKYCSINGIDWLTY